MKLNPLRALRNWRHHSKNLPKPRLISLWHHFRTQPVLGHRQLKAQVSVDFGRDSKLAQLALAPSAYRLLKWEKYFDFYSSFLDSIAVASRSSSAGKKPIRLLEIGVFDGGSLALWRKYFGPNAVIFGIDIDPRCEAINGVDAQVRIGSQTDPEFLNRVIAEMGGLDIVVDDGSHNSRDVVATFTHLFPALSSPGHYFVEDLHTSYWPRFGGGLRRASSSIEFFKKLVDEMNSFYFNATVSRAISKHPEISSSTIGRVTFSDSLVAVSKEIVSLPRKFDSSVASEKETHSGG